MSVRPPQFMPENKADIAMRLYVELDKRYDEINEIMGPHSKNTEKIISKLNVVRVLVNKAFFNSQSVKKALDNKEYKKVDEYFINTQNDYKSANEMMDKISNILLHEPQVKTQWEDYLKQKAVNFEEDAVMISATSIPSPSSLSPYNQNVQMPQKSKGIFNFLKGFPRGIIGKKTNKKGKKASNKLSRKKISRKNSRKKISRKNSSKKGNNNKKVNKGKKK